MSEIVQLAKLAGIQTEYQDIWGKFHYASEPVLQAILKALGFPSQDEEELAESKTRLAARHIRALPYIKIIASEKQVSFASPGTVWELTDEAGQAFSGYIRRGRITLPPLKIGYYRLRVQYPEGEITTTLMAAPEKCWQPEDMARGKRVWGVAAQLYGLRSRHDQGLGDFTDLAQLAGAAAKLGANVIGVNPLHAMFPSNPAHYSPYSPSSRLGLNLLYIATGHDSPFPAADYVDYLPVASVKREQLEAHYAAYAKEAAFEEFRAAEGDILHKQALFDALSEQFGPNWYAWPAEYHDPDGTAVRQFADQHKPRVDFFAWAQWQADTQLGKVQETALTNGMRLGLYRDLAVGCEKTGAERWMGQENFVSSLSVGVPGDEYNPNGQNWGLLPLDPLRLEESGMGPFITLVRANMRHAGALRIDHIFGLSRLFLIPEGETDGAYVTYPLDAFLTVLRIESHLRQCVVIGEDLGTPAPGYKEKADEAGVFSYKVLYFEKDENGFVPPHHYPARALATLSTHDLPTLTGWLANADIEERGTLGLYPSPELAEMDTGNRRHAVAQLGEALKKDGLDGVTHANVHRYLGRSTAAIVMLQLEDILEMKTQVNLPGTSFERPNWRLKLPQTLEEIIAKPLAAVAPIIAAERAKELVNVPRATYRLQFHKEFTFADAVAVLPYLKELGISHVYASPYTQARPGSMHGYDITDHNLINPELGGEEGYALFLAALREQKMGHILDFVPNHIGVGVENLWWQNILEWGELSPCHDYFDIDWHPRHGAYERKLILPVLAEHYGDALDQGYLKLGYDAETGSFHIRYMEERFPVCPRDYHQIDPALQPVETPGEEEPLKEMLRSRSEKETAIHLAEFNKDTGRIHALLERQHYRLTYWRTAASDINYRRFFDINELAGIRVEHSHVFDAMHVKVLSLIEAGHIDGLRIDHIDGLADPAGYCRKLRARAGAHLYLTVEKILGVGENLPEDWQIQGTSGYEVLNDIAAVLVDTRGEKAMSRIYRRFTGDNDPFDEQVYAAKLAVLEHHLASELQSLSLLLNRISDQDLYHRDYPFDTLKQGLREMIGHFPVYRSYVTPEHISGSDQGFIELAWAKAKRTSQFPDLSVYDFIGGLLLNVDAAPNSDMLEFIRKFQQLSGPVMAKGLEDTSFYRYNRLLALNEVGGNPARFGLEVGAFHTIIKTRAEALPYGMIATATHDTKRGEDARMRLCALSEMPREWLAWLREWQKINRTLYRSPEGEAVPSANESYFIYQTLLATWPVEMLEQTSSEGLKNYIERFQAYLQKALREAKEHSNWAQPNVEYENHVMEFIQKLLNPSHRFLAHFLGKAEQVAKAGAMKSLSQLILKLTLPGVPDIYQGTEYWDLSMVDPDNRRPVDYAVRLQSLEETANFKTLCKNWKNGYIKQHILHHLLLHRRDNPELYGQGTYEPLEMTGAHAGHMISYMRRSRDKTIIVILPLRASAEPDEGLSSQYDSHDTAIARMESGNFRNILSDSQGSLNDLLKSDSYLVLEKIS